MFRATKCSSSGESIVSIRPLVCRCMSLGCSKHEENWNKQIQEKELCVKLFTYKDCDKMHCQQNTRSLSQRRPVIWLGSGRNANRKAELERCVRERGLVTGSVTGRHLRLQQRYGWCKTVMSAYTVISRCLDTLWCLDVWIHCDV